MRVLVDTGVWSLALRRTEKKGSVPRIDAFFEI